MVPAVVPPPARDNMSAPLRRSRAGHAQAAPRSGPALPSTAALDRESCNALQAGHGAISQLQEFVQSSKMYPVAPHRQILQWSFRERMNDSTTLEFRATVAFLLEGVPHHVAGSWHTSKKVAQRAAAEQALGFFVGRWGSYSSDVEASAFAAVQEAASDVEVLEDYCRSLPHTGAPAWSLERVDTEGPGPCRALVELQIHGVRHTFPGSPKRCAEDAREDTAQRILWYLACPGYDNVFEPDVTILDAKVLQDPPEKWAVDPAQQVPQQVAERKTALMRVQNRLQRAFAKKLVAGESVWDWSFESTEDAIWPPNCRATVHIPAADDAVLVGNWVRGQREAQLDTCRKVTELLDRLEAVERGV